MKKTATIKLQGKDYAQVKDRIKEFRADCPNGLIETTPTLSESSLIFKARILKDKSDEHSAEAVGHSFAVIKKIEDAEKQFEKQETIAVGRALALLGYASDGEIASGEEMAEFLADKQEKLAEAVFECSESIGNCESVEALKTYWTSLSAELINNKALIEAKNAKYRELTNVKDVA